MKRARTARRPVEEASAPSLLWCPDEVLLKVFQYIFHDRTVNVHKACNMTLPTYCVEAHRDAAALASTCKRLNRIYWDVRSVSTTEGVNLVQQAQSYCSAIISMGYSTTRGVKSFVVPTWIPTNSEDRRPYVSRMVDWHRRRRRSLRRPSSTTCIITLVEWDEEACKWRDRDVDWGPSDDVFLVVQHPLRHIENCLSTFYMDSPGQHDWTPAQRINFCEALDAYHRLAQKRQKEQMRWCTS